MTRLPTITFLTAHPLHFEADANAGVFWVSFLSTFARMNPETKQAEEFAQPVRLGVTRGAAQQLLVELPRLQAMRAQFGPEPSKAPPVS